MNQKEFASLGRKARAKKLSKKQRAEIAKNAVDARWRAYRERQPSPNAS